MWLHPRGGPTARLGSVGDPGPMEIGLAPSAALFEREVPEDKQG